MELKAGDRIEFKGVGKVLSVSGSNETRFANIRFDGCPDDSDCIYLTSGTFTVLEPPEEYEVGVTYTNYLGDRYMRTPDGRWWDYSDNVVEADDFPIRPLTREK